MLNQYCDAGNSVIINYLSNNFDDKSGLEKLNAIYNEVKNSIYYDSTAPIQRASETLVMGRGNNFDKNVLLHTLLKTSGFNCKLLYKFIIDRTERLAGIGRKEAPWFYVEIEFFNKKLYLDASFDREFLRISGVEDRSRPYDFAPENYFIDDKRIFESTLSKTAEFSDNIIRIMSKGRYHTKLFGSRRSSYV